MSIISDLLAGVDDILGLRDSIGAVIQNVAIVTVDWNGSEPGDGDYTATAVNVRPSPRIKELLDDYRIKQGGAFEQGDLLLKGISKNAYPDRSDIDGTTEAADIEKFYKVGDVFYRVIAVEEKYLTWDVQVRRVTDRTFTIS